MFSSICWIWPLTPSLCSLRSLIVDEMKIRDFSSSSNPLFKFCMLALSDSNLLRISIQMLGRNSFVHRSFSLTHFEYFSSSMALSMVRYRLRLFNFSCRKLSRGASVDTEVRHGMCKFRVKYFSARQEKFGSSSDHVMLYLSYKHECNTKPLHFASFSL